MWKLEVVAESTWLEILDANQLTEITFFFRPFHETSTMFGCKACAVGGVSTDLRRTGGTLLPCQSLRVPWLLMSLDGFWLSGGHKMSLCKAETFSWHSMHSIHHVKHCCRGLCTTLQDGWEHENKVRSRWSRWPHEVANQCAELRPLQVLLHQDTSGHYRCMRVLFFAPLFNLI